MRVRESELSGLHDDALPALGVLLTDPAPLLAAAIAEDGGTLRWAQPRQATWQPGRSLTVRYDARIAWPGRADVEEMLVASTGLIPDGATVLHDGDAQAGVWRALEDPKLPGLAAMNKPGMLDGLLDDLGVGAGPLRTRLVAYRPTRRAVVQLRRHRTTLYCKVVRPAAAGPMHQRHLLLRPHVPVPHSLGVDSDLGLVVLQGLPGTLMRNALATAQPLPGPGRLLAVLDRLPSPPTEARSPGWRAGHYANLLTHLRPSQKPTLDDLTAQLDQVDAHSEAPLVPVHGDFHEAQLLIAGTAVSGVLDIDTFAHGRRVDDLATLVGHLSTLALTSRRRAGIEGYACQLLRAFDQLVDPVTLRLAIAAVVLGLATGPFRVLEERWAVNTDARIDLARRWVASAGRVRQQLDPRERCLTPLSDASHAG